MPITDRLRKPFLLVTAITVSSLLAACSGTEPPPSPSAVPTPARSPATALTATPGASTEVTKIPDEKDLIKIQTSRTVFQVKKEDMQKMAAIPGFAGFNYFPFITPVDQQIALQRFGTFLKENKDAIWVYMSAGAGGLLKLAGVAVPIVGESAAIGLIGAASGYTGMIQGMAEGPTITRPIMDINNKLIGYEDVNRVSHFVVRTYNAVANEADAEKAVEQTRAQEKTQPSEEKRSLKRVAHVEDQNNWKEMVADHLADLFPNSQVDHFFSCEALLTQPNLNYDLFILDSNLSRGGGTLNGPECAKRILALHPTARVVALYAGSKSEFNDTGIKQIFDKAKFEVLEQWLSQKFTP